MGVGFGKYMWGCGGLKPGARHWGGGGSSQKENVGKGVHDVKI